MVEENKFTYRNKSNTTQSLVGYGNVLPGETITSDTPIYNPNFVLVDAGRMVNVESPVEQPKVDKTLKGNKK